MWRSNSSLNFLEYLFHMCFSLNEILKFTGFRLSHSKLCVYVRSSIVQIQWIHHMWTWCILTGLCILLSEHFLFLFLFFSWWNTPNIKQVNQVQQVELPTTLSVAWPYAQWAVSALEWRPVTLYICAYPYRLLVCTIQNSKKILSIEYVKIYVIMLCF